MKQKQKKTAYLLQFIKMVWKWKTLVFWILISGLIGTITAVLAPEFLGAATDNLVVYIEEGFSTEVMYTIIMSLFIALILYIFSNALSYLQHQRSVVLSQKISYLLRDRMIKKIPKIPYLFFETRQTGDIMSRFANDIDLIGENLPLTIINLTSFIISIIGISSIVFFINNMIGICFVTLLFVAIVLILLMIKISQPYFNSQQKRLGKLNGFINESYEGQETIFTFNAQDIFIKKLDKLNSALYKDGFLSTFLNGFVGLFNNVFYLVAFSVIIIFGVRFTIDGSLSIGQLQTLLLYAFLIEVPLSQISSIISLIQQLIASGKRVFDFLNEKEIDQSSWVLNKEDFKNLNIDIKNMSFEYKKDKEILSDINLNIPYKSKIAIVGPTGSGKSTIAKLLLGFYDTYEGSIMLGDCEIKNLEHKDLREIVGIVAQNMWIQAGSIADNITLNQEDDFTTNVERMNWASQMSCLDQIVSKLDGGYSYIVDNNQESLSIGELQLINIARAFYSDKKIIVFDEATSYVDINTEKLIQKAMYNISKGKTLIIIAHRLSTIVDCDNIIYLENGKIVESGTHDELIEKQGKYFQMYNSQFLNK